MNRFDYDIGYGMMNHDVYRLQLFLESQGYAKFGFMFIPVGSFGDKTLDAVKAFQTKNGITPVSGYFGPKSRAVANSTIMEKNRLRLYDVAYGCLGLDASPNDLAPDEYGCAETVTDVMRNAGIDIPIIVSTARLYTALINRSDFIPVDRPLHGDIIISPTGMGNGQLPNGHVGIVGKNQAVMSNSSSNGKFEENYTIWSWRQRYQVTGGYPVFFFRRL